MCSLAYVIKLIIPRKDGLVVHQELHVRINVFLGRYYHGFGLAGICCEMINIKLVMDSINVFLEVREVSFTGDRLVKGGVISIEYQSTVFGEIRETQVVSIDKKRKRTQDRAPGTPEMTGTVLDVTS